MIDWHRVEELKEEVGADDFPEVVALFLAEVEDEIAALDDTGDAAALEARLHFLKGSALNLGFAAFSEICHEGETAAANGDARAVDSGAIRSCYTASRAVFLDRLG